MARIGFELITPPAAEPIELVGDVKAQSRLLEMDDENLLLASYIRAARELVEEITGRQVMPATWRMYMSSFPGRNVDNYTPTGWRFGEVRLPKPPLISVDLLRYIDVDGALTTLATSEYQWSNKWTPARLRPARFKVWPIVDPYSLDAVQITFTAGYATAAIVPARIKQAIRLIVAHWYENREAASMGGLADLPFGVRTLLSSLKTGEYV